MDGEFGMRSVALNNGKDVGQDHCVEKGKRVS